MSRVQVVMAAMNQTDFSLVKKLNISCDAVVANQADNEAVWEMNTPDKCTKLVTTKTRGVGKNRNIGIANATGEILLFADDDLKYNDDMPDRVAQAFDELKSADVIIFGTFFSKGGEIYERVYCKTGKLSRFRSMRYGTYAVAIRNDSLKRAGLSFNENFGGGCIYCHGEDSDFIYNCYKRGLSVYTYDYVLGTASKDNSSWFCGYNEKYFYDTGALLKNTFGALAYPYMLRLALKTKSEDMGLVKKLYLMNSGYKNYKNLVSYEEWKKR